MRSVCLIAVGVVACLALSTLAKAQEEKGKETTLKGTITCAKCDLKEAEKCQTVIKVNEDGKDVVYYFDNSSHKKNHKAICMDPKKGTVKGVVTEKDGKKWIAATSVEFDKE
jgi:hypothetical protein